MLIDADAQGSLTSSLGVAHPDNLESETLATKMVQSINGDEVTADGIMEHQEDGQTIFFLPGNIDLSVLEVQLVNTMTREYVLKRYIEQIENEYDYILIDCMPSLGMVTINALAAADSVLIPVQAAYLPVKGLQQLFSTISKVKRQLNRNLKIEGILMTMIDYRTNFAKDIAQMLRSAYGEDVRFFNTEIPTSIRAAEAAAEGVSVYKHDPKGKVSLAYKQLVKEILNNEQC